MIGRPGGYAVTSSRSNGLESNYVKQWLLRKFALFFVPREATETKGGQLITPLTKDLKVLYLRIILNGEKEKEPTILMGKLFDIQVKKEWEKFVSIR